MKTKLIKSKKQQNKRRTNHSCSHNDSDSYFDKNLRREVDNFKSHINSRSYGGYDW